MSTAVKMEKQEDAMQVITDEALYRRIWDRIYQDFSFSTGDGEWLRPAGESERFRLKSFWNEKQEAIINEILCNVIGEEMYALDWQHDCFVFSPAEQIPTGYQYHDSERDCNVYFPSYYPNGDYYFFVTKDFSSGLFGHPWRNELVVTGAALLREIRRNAQELDLEQI